MATIIDCVECGWNHEDIEVHTSINGQYYECPLEKEIIFLETAT